jgi:DNA-binding transcriptional MerR regulator/methylmalonyl-CoA mutase cobalamin-binding subunit
MVDGTPYYSPAQIERLTQIPMNTLRAWERRYGVPKPNRGPGGHRMYSESDVQTLLWLQKQLAAGIPIGHAIAGMKSHQPEGPRQSPEALAEELVLAGRALDERRFDKILSDATALHPVERVCLEIIAPALQRVGELWETGEVSVTVEHFISSQCQAHLYAMMRTLPLPAARPLLFVASTESELHSIPALLLTVLLRRHGWRAMYFGANLQPEDVAAVLPDTRPDALLLSVTMRERLDELGPMLARIKERYAIPIVVGGQALVGNEGWPAEHGARYLGHDMGEAIAQLSRLDLAAVPV